MSESRPPSPALFFETVNAYQRTAAIKSAIELGLFTALAESGGLLAEAARRIGAPVDRGVRILCDHLVILGFLTKHGGNRYTLTPDTATFLDKRSPAYMGGAIEFLLSPLTTEHFQHLTDSVQHGGNTASQNTVTPEHPIWVQFARAMAPMMAMPAQLLAGIVLGEVGRRPIRVLDIAAGHGLYGLTLAKQNPQARVVGLDWAPVLQVAKENARRMGVDDRYDVIAGDAFEVDLGTELFDVVLLPNFLHHFDVPTNEGLLRRLRGKLTPGGLLATVEFIPADDRVTLPGAASFALTMLAHTPGGDAYTFADLKGMFERAGFSKNELRELPGMWNTAVISRV